MGERTCIGCRRVAGPDELVRIARRADGDVVAGRHAPGRGAWLCRAASGVWTAPTVPLGLPAAELAHSEAAESVCFEMAVRRNAFPRALRCEVGGYVIDKLRRELVAGAGQLDDPGTGGVPR